MIANAVWKRFNQEQAAQHSRRAEEQGWTTSIYSFWNAETACGLRHGSPTRFGDMFDWPALSEWLRSARGIRGTTTWREFQARTGQALDAVAMLSGHPGDPLGEKLPCADADGPTVMRFFDADFAVARRVCVQSTSRQHEGGFNLRFLDMPRLADAVRGAVARARREGRRWAAVGLYLYWVEGAERARLHPARYGKLSTHSLHMSIFRGLFAPAIERRAAVVMSRLGLRGQPFLAVHWRRGDWFLGPHPRKLESRPLWRSRPRSRGWSGGTCGSRASGASS
ncbi:unnamed protein product [Prorocentrum cordatum]|uniref:Peptide-O-fucosyltransferase n=1 Tax=Prorocentrum cordatum TaxID=2364126 RepID=A0ABN9YF06_9DINO|nr:unnamed protein product [Polarella glacialis]